MLVSFRIQVLLFAVLIFSACKKVETLVEEIQTPSSAFRASTINSNSGGKTVSEIALVDSAFYFENLSETGADISYHWDFGDGIASDLQNPTHAYPKAGKYTVQLITSRNNQAADTARAVLSVILGLKEFSLGNNISTTAIDFAELADQSSVLLGSGYDMNIFPNQVSYFLMRLDKDLKQTSLKAFPLSTVFNSISPCTDGNLILTGTTSGKTDYNELIKVSPEGTVLWSKVIQSQTTFTKAEQTADKGFILTGSRKVPNDYSNYAAKTVVIKTDENGTVQWEKFFNTDFVIDRSYNTIPEADGYTLAATKRGSACFYCDSIAIVRLNNNGAIVWKKTIEASLNREVAGQIRIAKTPAGNYQVISSYARGLFLFSSQGQFLDRRLLNGDAMFNTTTKSGNLVVILDEWSNGSSTKMSEFSETAEPKWNLHINLLIGNVCCADSRSVTVKALQQGGSLFVSNRINYNNDYRYSIVLFKLDDDGKQL